MQLPWQRVRLLVLQLVLLLKCGDVGAHESITKD
jgi:hypothetical protein